MMSLSQLEWNKWIRAGNTKNLKRVNHTSMSTALLSIGIPNFTTIWCNEKIMFHLPQREVEPKAPYLEIWTRHETYIPSPDEDHEIYPHIVSMWSFKKQYSTLFPLRGCTHSLHVTTSREFGISNFIHRFFIDEKYEIRPVCIHCQSNDAWAQQWTSVAQHELGNDKEWQFMVVAAVSE